VPSAGDDAELTAVVGAGRWDHIETRTAQRKRVPATDLVHAGGDLEPRIPKPTHHDHGRQPIMRAVVLHESKDVRVEQHEDPRIQAATDAIIRISAACVCGSDLWPYRGIEEADDKRMGHEYVGAQRQHHRAVSNGCGAQQRRRAAARTQDRQQPVGASGRRRGRWRVRHDGRRLRPRRTNAFVSVVGSRC